MLADATVHTAGLNIESIITITSAIVVLLSVIIGTFIRFLSKAITSAVNDLASRLETKLETKERVSAIESRVTVLELHNKR